ncbi:MAG: MDR family MFS transporter [Ktedonobacteraceae bacterium]
MKNPSRETNSGTLVLESPQAVPEQDTETPRYSRRDVLLTMAGVLMVMLLASLDQTIVSTAMPHVIADLQGFDRYTWVTTAYLLTSTVMVPIYGKLSDLLGRKSVFLFGVIIFLIGSAASGASQSMNQLIAFRAFQGIGAAALMPIAIAIIGDLFTPRERGKWQGVTGAVFGLSSIVGPAAGGWITENASWRWVFYVNLPVGIIALLVLIFLMPSLHRRAEQVSIDYLGAALLVIGTVPLLLGFTWAGSQYAWLSPQIIGIFAFALVVLTVFGIYEGYLAGHDAQPIIDPRLFKSGVFSLSVLITTITSMGMFGSIFFLPLFAQGVLGISATNSGFLLSPMMIALIASSVISGQLVSRTGKYKWIAILGMFITVGGTLLLYRLNVNSVPLDLTLAMIVLGLGLGFGMALYTIIVQNAWPNKIGEATSALTFFRQIGATVALAAMGSIMSAAYVPAFHDALPASVKHILPAQVLSFFDNPNILLSADAQKQMITKFASFGPQGMALYQQILEAVKVGLTQGIHNVFILSTVLMILGLVAVFFLKEIPLRGGKKQSSTETLEETVEEVEGISPTMLH